MFKAPDKEFTLLIMNATVAAYLERIGYEGPVNVDRQTFFAIHRAHILAIPYENLEIQFGRENLLSETVFVEKLVTRRRGGWCYEMNGLLTAILKSIGFAVTRAGGAVVRERLGAAAIGNHLIGLVEIGDQCYVSDVGLGDGPLDPFPLEEGNWKEGALGFSLERLWDGWWRFHNHVHSFAPSFDFTEEERPLCWYQPTCSRLQTEDASPFVNYAMAFRRNENGTRSLRDTSFIEVRNGHRSEREVDSAEEYTSLLGEILSADLGRETDLLWAKVSARACRRAEEAVAEEIKAAQTID